MALSRTHLHERDYIFTYFRQKIYHQITVSNKRLLYFPCKPCFGLQVQDASTDSNNLNDRHVKTKKALKLFDQTIPPDSKRASDYDKHNLCFQDI